MIAFFDEVEKVVHVLAECDSSASACVVLLSSPRALHSLLLWDHRDPS